MGTCRLDGRAQAVVGAIREALTDAAKHAGIRRVSVYTEVADDELLALIRDRGRGSDVSVHSRLKGRGITDSIEGRLHPHGGTATIRSTLGRRHRRGAPGAVRGPRIRVYVVDDHAVVRSGVHAEVSDAVDIVGEAATVAEAIDGIRALRPDVVLLDVRLPDGGGRAVLDAVLPSHPQGRFLALSVSDAAADVLTVVRGGARGYVTRKSANGCPSPPAPWKPTPPPYCANSNSPTGASSPVGPPTAG